MRYLRPVLKAVLALCLLQAVSLPVVIAGGNTVLAIDEVLRNVDPAKVTKWEVKEYWREINGKKVKGEGTVVHVLPLPEGGERIAVLAPGSNPEKGYNVMLYVTQEPPLDLRENDRISFEGEISRLSAYMGALIDVRKATFQKKADK